MFVQVKNENYGFSTATYGEYVAVGNPPVNRNNYSLLSELYTGSVDIFRFNKNINQHDYVGTLFRNFIFFDVILAREIGTNPPERDPFITEDNNTGLSANANIEIDKNNYTGSLYDGFGFSMDMYDKILAVGSTYYTEFVKTNEIYLTQSNSSVNIFDLSLTEYLSSSANPYIASLESPEPNTGSYGWSVSVNNEWIAVGSPFVSQSNGQVYLYRNTGSGYDWNLYQIIQSPNNNIGEMFGYSLKLNKQSGSYSGSLIVGYGLSTANSASYYEFISGSWVNTFTFEPNTSVSSSNLTFGNFSAYGLTFNNASYYGSAVSLFGDTVVIGSYSDRIVSEFNGSDTFLQGAAYVYEKCDNMSPTNFQMVLKSYGNEKVLKNNFLGYSVDIFSNNILVGIPKIDKDMMTSCYLVGTLNQVDPCTDDLETELSGQAMFIQKNTSSLNWEISNIYQKKKQFLSPYRNYGENVAVGDFSMVVGSPMEIDDSNRQFNVNVTQSGIIPLDDISGKSYIYNLNNFSYQFHVGNVFYRNGKIVLITSGSVFDGLFLNPASTNSYEYDLQFTSQHTVFEKQIVCTVNPGEFNTSTNPTAIGKTNALLDINNNGKFDFQDVDVILRYMQYKNTSILGVPVTTDWSSSIVTADDEKSFLKFNQSYYDNSHTSILTSESIVRFESINTNFQNIIDFNQDNKIDSRDMNILWKYFSNRLTQNNYSTFITSTCNRTLFSDVIDYMGTLSGKNAIPMIKSQFFDYETSVANDKTGSFLAPYCTHIGLYSGLDLVCVASLGSPIKITPELPINFVIKLDF